MIISYNLVYLISIRVFLHITLDIKRWKLQMSTYTYICDQPSIVTTTYHVRLGPTVAHD